MAEVTCHLKLYKLENDQYPESLELLKIPMPRDIYQPGTSLKYKLIDPNKYILYRCGPDQIDDGGTDGVDLIWLQGSLIKMNSSTEYLSRN